MSNRYMQYKMTDVTLSNAKGDIAANWDLLVIRNRLRRLGVTELGITQLVTGTQVTNPKDQTVVSGVALSALSQ